MPFPYLILSFLLSLGLAALLTRAVRNLALRRGWNDAADSGRHLHRKPVPRLGGVAIFLAVAGVAAGAAWVEHWAVRPGALPYRPTFAILLPAILIFLVGLYDDFRKVSPAIKFCAQIAAACLLYAQGIGIHQFTFLDSAGSVNRIAALPLTIIWVALITNAFNLIDGLDGLASGAALFSTTVLVATSLVGGNYAVAFLALVLAGAIAGFMRFNIHPATIFLGDCGSLFIGFMLSALALAGAQKASTMVAVAIPVVCFGLPILDVAFALLRRFLNGKPLFQPDAEHIHHRLLKRGFSQRHAVLILYGVCAFFGLLSLAMLHGERTTALVLVVLAAGVTIGIPQLRYPEFQEMGRVLERTAGQKRIIENNLCVRHAEEALQAAGSVPDLIRILSAALQPIGFDGFGLKLPASVRLASSPVREAQRGADGEWKYFWSPADHPPAWQLTLELVDADGGKYGSFSVYRTANDKPLLMDINLLSNGFQSALAAAIRRAAATAHPEGAEPARTRAVSA